MPSTDLFGRLDPDQRAAVALRRNGTVSAGAGSGKTTVLAARYLDLLSRDAAELSSILCLTFTRKAQSEMQSRVWRELGASPEERAKAQLGRFAEASILTIDSFCSSLLRGSAQDYGYAPSFLVDDQACRDLAEAESLRFLLGRREESCLEALFAGMGFERAWRGLFAEAAYRFATPALRPEADFAAMPARAAAALEAAGKAALSSLAHAGSAAAFAAKEGPITTKKGIEALAVLSALPDGPLDLAGAACSTATLASLAMNGFGRSGSETALKEAAKAGREAARRLGSLAEAQAGAPLEAAILRLLAEFADLYRKAKRDAGIMGFHDVAVCAVDLLSRRLELRAFWKKRFRYIMVDEFQDDNELQKELLYLLAEDEASSSPGIPGSASLAPDKLFFVGDDKQSIYRFRGADVSVFNRLGAELRGGEGDSEGFSPRLRTNYRSEPGLIAFFNEVFAKVFGGASADYEAGFEETIPRGPSPGIKASLRFLWKPRSVSRPPDGILGDDPPTPGDEASKRSEDKPRQSDDASKRSDDEALADGIVTFIKDAVEGGKLLLPAGAANPDGSMRATGATRAAEYDDIAILLRSTSKQFLLERFLRLHGIGYTADSVRGLFVESIANDIYAALRLALLPEDRLAYATVLRSPLVALSDDGFVKVLSRPAEEKARPFAEADEALLGADDACRFRHGRDSLADLSSRVDRESLADLVSFLWFDAGLRLSILRRPDAHPYLEHYDYLYALAVQSDSRSEGLSVFLSRLEPLMGQPEKLDDAAIQREAGSGVRLMSVHRSKGLEFPVVIIPWMENQGQLDGAGEAFYLSDTAGITLNLVPLDEPGATRSNVFYEEAKALDVAKSRAETKRLFYVACTRAETHLVFAGVEPWRADSVGASFLGLLAPGMAGLDEMGRLPGLPSEIEFQVLPDLQAEAYGRLVGGARSASHGGGPRRDLASMSAAYAIPPRTAGADEGKPRTFLDRSYAGKVLPATALEAVAFGGGAGASGESLPPTALDGKKLPPDFEALFGEACHAAIEAFVQEGRLALRDRYLDVLPEGLRSLAKTEAIRLAQGFLDSEIGRHALAFPRIETEKGFILKLPGANAEGAHWRITGRMDLFAESAKEIIIVDFKSNARFQSGEYEVQMALYRMAAAALAPGKAVKSYLFWLRGSMAREATREMGDEKLQELAGLAAAARIGIGTAP